MKKLLSLLGAFGLTATASATVVACGNNSKQETEESWAKWISGEDNTLKTFIDFISKGEKGKRILDIEANATVGLTTITVQNMDNNDFIPPSEVKDKDKVKVVKTSRTKVASDKLKFTPEEIKDKKNDDVVFTKAAGPDTTVDTYKPKNGDKMLVTSIQEEGVTWEFIATLENKPVVEYKMYEYKETPASFDDEGEETPETGKWEVVGVAQVRWTNIVATDIGDFISTDALKDADFASDEGEMKKVHNWIVQMHNEKDPLNLSIYKKRMFKSLNTLSNNGENFWITKAPEGIEQTTWNVKLKDFQDWFQKVLARSSDEDKEPNVDKVAKNIEFKFSNNVNLETGKVDPNDPNQKVTMNIILKNEGLETYLKPANLEFTFKTDDKEPPVENKTDIATIIKDTDLALQATDAAAAETEAKAKLKEKITDLTEVEYAIDKDTDGKIIVTVKPNSTKYSGTITFTYTKA